MRRVLVRAPLAITLAGSLSLALAGCPEKTDAAPKDGERAGAGPASAPSSRPSQVTAAGPAPIVDHAKYVTDEIDVPTRVGVKRVFLRQSRVSLIRDPVFLDDQTVAFVAKVSGVLGIWKLGIAGDKPAELILPRPLADPSAKPTARNRGNWFIGTPRLFPDGKHLIFEGTNQNPYQPYTNVLGIAPTKGGPIAAIEAKGVKAARTPDVHKDGETVVFSSCDELRVGRLKGRDDQELESTVVLKVPRLSSVHEATCTVYRPRFSPDGKRIVFELIGKFVDEAFKKENKIPDPINEADFLLEPWIVNADGTGLTRLVSEDAYKTISGRLQSGGTKDPVFSPDGREVAFSHGNSIAVVSVDGKSARVVAAGAAPGAGGNVSLHFLESDPAFSPDGRYLVSASTLEGGEKAAPPGLSVIDLKALAPKQDGEAPPSP